jgi:hypothetical protein
MAAKMVGKYIKIRNLLGKGRNVSRKNLTMGLDEIRKWVYSVYNS